MRVNTDISRLWLFRGLAAVVAGLMVKSFNMPWWYCEYNHISIQVSPIEIYAYGLRHSLIELRPYIVAYETPLYQTVLAWIYLATSAVLILYSTWFKGNKGRWLLGSIGFIYIAYAAVAIMQIAIHTSDFGFSMQGWTTIKVAQQVFSIFATFRVGYYLANAVGLSCIILALLRNLITGKPKLGT